MAALNVPLPPGPGFYVGIPGEMELPATTWIMSLIWLKIEERPHAEANDVDNAGTRVTCGLDQR
ncbi:predicted protein [Pyrenophora tritici-repentis Pt-1C-BFP]|uniref:Uncharacterized protein n=1 Tax=Pyrenophora tritici-repentis (strain Pt-1C-BFP) TaxID=426418 RepID=B2WD16_PYRTR|nr:uncharacterized protein PTRG_07875 [Pyrenophora tritici-repentis Pt-1C-BFP]EDU50794.1 predicted protein [Pyrenophora tritici-repentis Pt-1C-BFP]